jgi:hypothetical protein
MLMPLSKFCKIRGFNLDEYKQLKDSIEKYITDHIQTIPNKGNGMYYETKNLVEINNELRPYIINEAKKQGIEFAEDYTLYRY